MLALIPNSLGFSFSSEAAFQAPINGGIGSTRPAGMAGDMSPMMRGGGKKVGEYITDLDMAKYLNYVVSTQALKAVSLLGQLQGGRSLWM
jgi:hypothetical protein